MSIRTAAFLLLFLAFLGVSCKSTKATLPGSDRLAQSTWTLIELDGKPVVPANAEKDAFLVFADQKVSGSTSCNRLTGSFTLSGKNKIRFSPLITTKMFCTGNTIENAFLVALEKVDTYLISDDGLVLSNGDSVLAKFKAKP